MNNENFLKVKKIELNIYPFNVCFFLLTEDGISLLEKGEEARTIKQDSNIFVYLRNNDISTLVHELFHVTEFIMGAIGETIADCPNESWAYLMGYLTKEGVEFLD